MNKRGRNSARITSTVFFALDSIGATAAWLGPVLRREREPVLPARRLGHRRDRDHSALAALVDRVLQGRPAPVKAPGRRHERRPGPTGLHPASARANGPADHGPVRRVRAQRRRYAAAPPQTAPASGRWSRQSGIARASCSLRSAPPYLAPTFLANQSGSSVICASPRSSRNGTGGRVQISRLQAGLACRFFTFGGRR